MITRSNGIEGLVEGYVPGVVEEDRIEVAGEDRFAELLEKYVGYLSVPDFGQDHEVIEKSITEILTPEEIDAFLQATAAYEDQEWFKEKTGFFISRLLQNSYNHSYNNFSLNMENIYPVNYICFKLTGTKERPIMVTIEGNVGYCLGFCSQGDSCFTIKGNVGEGSGVRAQRSTFKTTNSGAVDVLKRFVPKEQGNKIIFILPDGREQIIQA